MDEDCLPLLQAASQDKSAVADGCRGAESGCGCEGPALGDVVECGGRDRDVLRKATERASEDSVAGFESGAGA